MGLLPKHLGRNPTGPRHGPLQRKLTLQAQQGMSRFQDFARAPDAELRIIGIETS